MAELDVYLGDQLAGVLSGDSWAAAFLYDERWAAERPAISRQLPISEQPAPPGPTRVFFDGLLPEATLRSELARIWRCDPLDWMALLAAIGRESAGAVSVVPRGEPLPPPGDVEWCDEAGLAEQIAKLPTLPLASGPETAVRVSLGGAQDKLVLVRDCDRWGLPHPGTPSTHIAKPDASRATLPHLAANEYVCCRWAASVGAPTAAAELLWIGGRRVLVSERFDRKGVFPSVARLHQEDFAQLTGRLPIHKYEENGGPSVAECLAAIDAVSAQPVVDRRAFVDAVWVNALLGNGDAHSKNYALLLTTRTWRLAPLYDINCTLAYAKAVADHGLAMRFDGRTSGRWPDPDHLSGEALGRALESWGYGSRRARRATANRMVDLASLVVDTNLDELLSGGGALDASEERHVRLMAREITRRAGNLRSTATAVAGA